LQLPTNCSAVVCASGMKSLRLVRSWMSIGPIPHTCVAAGRRATEAWPVELMLAVSRIEQASREALNLM